MRQSEIVYWKTWRLRKALTASRKALSWNTEHPGGLARLMDESLRRDITKLETELKRRKDHAIP